MPLDLQAKILTVLDSHAFRRVGSTEELTADIRIVAATNEDLEAAVAENRFRQDLYYRLNVVPVELPPLRDRDGDVLLIARYFLENYTQRYERSHLRLSRSAERWLLNYPWPGNVRELRNVIERAVLLTSGDLIQAEDLAIGKEEGDFRQQNAPSLEIDSLGDIRISLPPWGIALEDVERRLIQESLNQSEGNVSRAAQLLHISRDTLRYRIQKFGLNVRDYPGSQDA